MLKIRHYMQLTMVTMGTQGYPELSKDNLRYLYC